MIMHVGENFWQDFKLWKKLPEICQIETIGRAGIHQKTSRSLEEKSGDRRANLGLVQAATSAILSCLAVQTPMKCKGHCKCGLKETAPLNKTAESSKMQMQMQSTQQIHFKVRKSTPLDIASEISQNAAALVVMSKMCPFNEDIMWQAV